MYWVYLGGNNCEFGRHNEVFEGTVHLFLNAPQKRDANSWVKQKLAVFEGG
jgi:hypothetical protein